MSDARKTILARRAKFVAAAIAGLASACGKEPKTDDAGAAPGPCLSTLMIEDAAKLDAGARAVDAGGDAAAAKPHACLCVCQPGDPLCSCL